MKKILVFILILIMLSFIVMSQQTKKTYNIKKAYVYLEEQLLISDTDLYCTFFLKKDLKPTIKIIGAEEMEHKGIFADGDKLFINKGSKDGLREGDEFIVLEKGKRIYFKLKYMGKYFLQKSRAYISCIYDNKAVITLKKGCTPVKIGDFLIPFKKEKTIFRKKLDYKRCRIPKDSIKATVFFIDLAPGFNKQIGEIDTPMAIDKGKGSVEKGNFVLFYRKIKNNLPEIIIGMGIVIRVDKNNSIIKPIELNYPVEKGAKVLILPEIEEEVTSDIQGETIPVIKKKREIKKEGINNLEYEVLFKINEAKINDKYNNIFENIKSFIEKNPNYSIVLRGYTCSIGSEEYNLKLSQKRVEAVKEILKTKCGVDENKIEIYYYGEKSAPYDNSTEVERRKNRMVKIEVIVE